MMNDTASVIRIRPNPPSLASAIALTSVKILPTDFRRILPVWQPDVCPRWTATVESERFDHSTPKIIAANMAALPKLKGDECWV